MVQLECDVAVIGAGTAGLAAERNARAAGARTLLVDDGFAGSTCAVDGCMPSKLLIAAADAAWTAGQAGVFGIRTRIDTDGTAVMTRLRQERDRFVSHVRDSIRKIPQEVRIAARARFAAPGLLDLGDGRRIRAGAIVIATGAAPVVPDAFSDVESLILTNETLFELKDLPAAVAVIGAGPLGVEMAQALARLGVRVEVFDRGDTLAGLSDRPVSDKLHALLGDEFPVHLGVSPSVSRDGKVVVVSCGGQDRRFDRLLVAAGRKPRLRALNLGAAELSLDDHGTPLFDPETLQCGSAPVFVAGDANHDRPVLHEAAHEGVIAGTNAARWPDAPLRHTRHAPLAIAFTRPETATVGQVPAPGDDDTATASADFDNQGRTTIAALGGGLCHLYARRHDGRLTGASLCAPGGAHLAHLLAWALEAGLSVADLLDRPFYHPTFEEGLKPALRQLCHETGQKPDQSRKEDSPLS